MSGIVVLLSTHPSEWRKGPNLPPFTLDHYNIFLHICQIYFTSLKSLGTFDHLAILLKVLQTFYSIVLQKEH